MKKLLLFALVVAGLMTSALDACCRNRCNSYNGRVLSSETVLVYPE